MQRLSSPGVVALVGWVLGCRGKRFDQIAREAEWRDTAEYARAQDLRPRRPGQKASLGFGIAAATERTSPTWSVGSRSPKR